MQARHTISPPCFNQRPEHLSAMRKLFATYFKEDYRSFAWVLRSSILWINWSLNAIDTIETWVSGNLTALTERSQPAIRWRVGEVANRVSCDSFPGGH